MPLLSMLFRRCMLHTCTSTSSGSSATFLCNVVTSPAQVTPTVLKNIAGQTMFQLAVMYWMVFVSPPVLGYDPGSSVAGASTHYTMVFNSFVMMQLFNQVRWVCVSH